MNTASDAADPRASRIAGLGVLSGYGAGARALIDGVAARACPARRADAIGFPGDPPPLAVRFPQSLIDACAPGEAIAAKLLLDTVEAALVDWGGDRALLAGENTLLIAGSGGFLYASAAELYWRATGGVPATSPFRVRDPDWGVSLLVERYGLRGPAMTLSTGCSSAANALLIAAEAIARGEVDRAIVVGAEGVSPVSLSGFDALMLIDPHGCRPFDRDREGLRLGEAIGVLMLEADDGRTPGVIVRGGANRCDTHHLTSASPDGAVMRDTMRAALEAASARAGDVLAVKAHGTGSIDSDRAEAYALRALFGEAMPPITALKPYFGHTLGACGAIETAAFALCVREGFVPATAGFAAVDPPLGIAPIDRARPASAGLYLLNYFGFGGNDTSLVLELRR